MEGSAKRRKTVQQEAEAISLFGLEHLPMTLGDRTLDVFGKVAEGDNTCLLLLAPEDINLSELSHLMSQAGTLRDLEQLKVQVPLSNHAVFSVHFEKPKDCKRALRIRSRPSTSAFQQMIRNTTVSSRNVAKLQQEADEAVAEYEAEESQDKATRHSGPKVGPDGFTKVVRKGRDNVFRQQESKQKKRRDGSLPQKAFYKFQFTRQKEAKLTELRKKFEQDKERLKKMKQSRQFKPY